MKTVKRVAGNNCNPFSFPKDNHKGAYMYEKLIFIFSCASFCFGAVIASFLNVVIYRVPIGGSIVTPPSHCPKCNSSIKWWQNIPVLSYLFLRGKCANCKERISLRYPFVEFLGGVLFLASFMHIVPSYGFTIYSLLMLALYWIWISLMIVGTFIDFDYKLLPDFVTVGGMILGIIYSLAMIFSSKFVLSTSYFAPLLVSLLGLVVGFGLLWIIRFIGSKAFKREAMGMGDVFLMGAIGAIFGPIAVLFTIVFSSFLGAFFGLIGVIAGSKRLGSFAEIPFGPYICGACLLWMFKGPEICSWYLSLIGIGG